MDSRQNSYKRNRPTYVFLLVLSLAFIVAAALTEAYTNLFLAVPTLLLTLYGFHRKNKLNLPPLLLVMLSISMVLLQTTIFLENGHYLLLVGADVVMGMFNCLLGLMIVMTMMKSSPGFDVERPFFVAFTSFCIGMTLSLSLCIADFMVSDLSGNGTNGEVFDFMVDLLAAGCGGFAIGLPFYLNRHNNLFKHTLDRFLKENADTLRLEQREKTEVLDEIEAGESSRLEFKSTLRTNLKTGEKDPRMERAVLKTLVAFLNSNGGTLFLGVSDDGLILGIDLHSFEDSRDKFGLHLNNLITQQIGGEFLPYINCLLLNFDGKYVMKIVCVKSDRPVFLRNGKEETFFVRSGPSTIDLHGVDLLYYANRRFGKNLNKPR